MYVEIADKHTQNIYIAGAWMLIKPSECECLVNGAGKQGI